METVTHLKDRMSLLVLELFWVMGKFPGRPAVIDMGGFWLGHLAMIRENELVSSSKNWKMVILHFRTGTWILRPESISVTCNSLFVGLPLLQFRQSPCFEHWVSKSRKERKNIKKRTALRNRVCLSQKRTQNLAMGGKQNNKIPYNDI